MSTPFEDATRAAIEEIIQNHCQESKFGFIMSEANLKDATDDLYRLLQTSRSLKTAGDRFISQASQPPQGAVSKIPNSQSRRPKW